jgi:hypothetical protein
MLDEKCKAEVKFALAYPPVQASDSAYTNAVCFRRGMLVLKIPRRAVLVAAVFALSACGGGGGGGARAVPSAATTGPLPTAAVSFTLAIPGKTPSKRGRLPAYVSSNTHQASITYTSSVNGQTATIGAGCTTSCAAAFQAPVGVDSFKILLQDQNGVTLSQGVTTALVSAGQNTISATFDGIVNDATLAISPASLPAGTPQTAFMYVNAHDPDGSTIVTDGTYVDGNGNPVVFTIANPAAQTAITFNSSGVSAPGTMLPVAYDGTMSTGTAFTLTTTSSLAGGVNGASLAIVPTTAYTYAYQVPALYGHELTPDGNGNYYAYADDYGIQLNAKRRWAAAKVRTTKSGPDPGSGGAIFQCCSNSRSSLFAPANGLADLGYDNGPQQTLYFDQGDTIVGDSLTQGNFTQSLQSANEVVQDLVVSTPFVFFVTTDFNAGIDYYGFTSLFAPSPGEAPLPENGLTGVGRMTYANGDAWFVESANGRIGDFSAGAPTVTEFLLPNTTDVPTDIVGGPGGKNIYILGYSNGDVSQPTIWQMPYTSSTPTVYLTLPAPQSSLCACTPGYNRLRAGSAGGSGALWTIDEANGDLMRIDLTTKTTSEATANTATNPFIEDFQVAGDGSIYYVGDNVNGVGHLIW